MLLVGNKIDLREDESTISGWRLHVPLSASFLKSQTYLPTVVKSQLPVMSLETLWRHPESDLTAPQLRSAISLAELAKEGHKPVEAPAGRAAAARMKAHSYHECSAKENRGVDQVFEAAVRAAKEARSTNLVAKIPSKCTLL